jgi:Raf kinase inhibitor-like YbhB/YbcL family protein
MKNFKSMLSTMLMLILAACGSQPVVGNTTEPVTATSSTGVFTAYSTFTLTSPDVAEGEHLPVEYTCDGEDSTLPLEWNGAPVGTKSFAVIMSHIAPETTHWYWVLYEIPDDVTSLPKNVSGIGILGNNINNGQAEYSPPCSQGPGDKTYTFTVYALSAVPQITVPAEEVDRDTLLAAMQDITLASAQLNVVYARQGMTDSSNPLPNNAQGGNGNQPGSGNQPDAIGNAYNIDQAISDKAQGMTIAFDALAFLTGDLGADSFFPPGKVADFWGFQYLRDNDPTQMGHAGDFLTSAAMNMLNVMTSDERAQLVALAENQVDSISEYGYKRFVLMQAFQDLIDGNLPAGTTVLDEEAVKEYSAGLYILDGEISYERAQLYGTMLTSFTSDQLAYLDSMKGQGMLDWPDVDEPSDLRNLDKEVKVAVMTYAADMFSWYAGSVDADVYFCPERHGTYFGSFYLKDIKAMSDPTYPIPTNLTGDLGDELLSNLNSSQAELITGLVDTQKPSLLGIVDIRRQVSIELRKFLAGQTADEATVLTLMKQYGEYDGEIIYNMATHFTAVKNSLSLDQQASIEAMRTELLGTLSHPIGTYLYSQPIPLPDITSSDFLFK